MSSLGNSLRVLLVLLSFAGYAHANFHLWRTDQVYSNADGSIQYVELTALAAGQEFISGHTISVTQGATTHTFTFTGSLSGDTAGKSLLLGTQGFANLGVVAPDVIIPDGFLFTTNGTVNWGGGFDIFTYASIPMDGNNALYRGGVVATNAPQNFAGQMGTIVPTPAPHLGNISTRMEVLTGNDVMIGGFVIGGSANKTVAITATGPSLAAFGITNPLANPMLQLVRSSDQSVIATNDDWQSDPNAALLQAAGFAPSNSLESGLYINLPPGAYTAIVSGVGGVTGVGIVGVYEVDHPETPLINISTRGEVLTGNDVMIGGFVVQGSAPQTLAITATGPSLAAFGITNPLANPTITVVRSSDQSVVASNDDWQTDPNAAMLQAAGFAPSNPLESGLLLTLQPGAYTVIVQGVGGGTGVAVVGVFTTP